MRLRHYLIAIGIILGVVTLFQMTADAQANPDANQPGYWCEEGFKIELSTDAREFVSDGDYVLVVIKAGTENYTFSNVREGDVLTVPKGISHIIFCRGTDEVPTTTTTLPEETTTTVGTTTTVTEESSTTTTEAQTTTTTLSSTTSTLQAVTTTSTVTSPSTTVGSVQHTELPFTGFNPRLLLAGVLSVIGGTALLAKARES